MNDVSKTNIQTRLIKALETEGISTTSAARCLGIKDTYLSMMKNPENWDKCPAHAWETVLAWVNSGQKIEEYSEKHGHVLPEKVMPKPGMVISKVIKVDPPRKAEPKPAPEPMIKIKPGVLEARQKELAERKPKPAPKLYPLHAVLETKHEKTIIDIEINLTINGKKIMIA